MLEVLNVRDGRIAHAFSNAHQRQLLLHLVGQERSLQWLATNLGIPLNLAHYHVERLLTLRLVEVARREPRAGRPVKFYRALAKSFFVPAHLTTRSPGDKLATELRTALERGRRRASADDGTIYFVDDRMLPRMRRIERHTKQVVAESWCILNLTDKDARSLSNEMKALWSRYEGLRGNRSGVYLAHCAIVPREALSARRR